MNLYYFIFVWIGFMAIVSQKVRVTKGTIVCGERVERWKLIWAFVAFAPVIYLAAFTTPRSDTGLYLTIYKNLDISWKALKDTLLADESGKGFFAFQWLIKNVFRGSETAYRLILALLHSIPVLYVFRKYSDNFILSLYLFVATGCHTAWMMNGLRQYLAVCIIMTATPLMIKRKYIPLIAVILLAATIHSSAILMLPIVFIIQGRAWNYKTFFFIIITIIMMYAFSNYTGLLDSMLEETEYAGTMASAIAMGDDGTNPIRVLVNSIPMLLSILGKKQIDSENNEVINLCVNMSIITSGLYLISMVTSGIMLGRLPIYTSLYSLIALPYFTDKIFTKHSSRIVNVLMIILYFMYYLYAYRNY